MNPNLSILAEVFGRYADIQALCLFGPRAVRAGRVDSDLNLAGVPRNGTVRGRKLEILTDLARVGSLTSTSCSWTRMIWY